MKSSTTETKKPHGRNSLTCVALRKKRRVRGEGEKRERGKREGVPSLLSSIPLPFYLPPHLPFDACWAGWNSHVGQSNFIHGSSQIRHMGRNWFKRRSFHVLNWRVGKFDDWTRPNFPFSPQLVNKGTFDWPCDEIRTQGRLVTDQGFRWYLELLHAEFQLTDLHSSYHRNEQVISRNYFMIHSYSGIRSTKRASRRTRELCVNMY